MYKEPIGKDSCFPAALLTMVKSIAIQSFLELGGPLLNEPSIQFEELDEGGCKVAFVVETDDIPGLLDVFRIRKFCLESASEVDTLPKQETLSLDSEYRRPVAHGCGGLVVATPLKPRGTSDCLECCV